MEARLWKVRVFSARDHCKGLEGLLADHIVNVDASTGVRVTIGAIPDTYVVANSNVAAILEMVLTGAGEPKPRPAPKEWVEPDMAYTCLCVSQVVEVAVRPQSAMQDYLWYDYEDVQSKLSGFRDQARSALDGVTGRLISRLGVAVLDSAWIHREMGV